MKYFKKLKTFFNYYGGKWRAAKFYPKPKYDTIIEPFAGAAGYSTNYSNCQVLLYDTNPIITSVWDYIIHVKEAEFRLLPIKVDHVDEINVCQEAKWLIGFWLNQGTAKPRKQSSTWAQTNRSPTPTASWGSAVVERIARQLKYVRHWKVFNQSYDTAENQQAVWFVDPPYQSKAGDHYTHRFRDFQTLAGWCKDRMGQVIVCEQSGADWLPFKAFRKIQSTPRKGKSKSHSDEVIWTAGCDPIIKRGFFG